MTIKKYVDVTPLRMFIGKIAAGKSYEVKLLLIMKCPNFSNALSEFIDEISSIESINFDHLVFFSTFTRSFLLKRIPLIRDKTLSSYKVIGFKKDMNKIYLEVEYEFE